MSFLELSGVTKGFGAAQVLRGVDLAVAEGGFLAVLGPSGCGKSTLLRIVAGLEAQDAGTVRIGGAPVDGLAPAARDVAMVFQSYALYPHMTVAENLALPLVMRDLTRRERLPLMRRLDARVAEKRRAIRREVEAAAAMVALSDLLDRKPRALSGGQRQRVALARALVRRPRLFLLDEPLSNLDAALRASTRTEIVELQRRLGVTTIYVTHDQTEAMTMADRIAVMMGGRIVQTAPAREIYRRPATLEVGCFVGSPRMTLFPGTLRGGILRLGNGSVWGRAAAPDQEVTLGFRAEDLHLADPASAPIPARIVQVEFLGAEALVHAVPDWPGTPPQAVLRVAAAEADRIAATGAAGIAPDLRAAHLFGADGARIELAETAPRALGLRA